MTPRAAPMTPDDRRRAILEALVPLIVEHGEVPSTKRIAEAAGIAEGTIFRVFEDKPALMRAVAEEAMRPPRRREDFEAGLAPIEDLREKVRVTAESLATHLSRSMRVMLAVRSHLQAQPRPEAPAGAGSLPEPPRFLTEANQELLEMFTWLFEPHRDDLRVPPETAALVLRSLVFGSRHPGIDLAPELTPDQIADVIIDGVTLPRGS